jgi:hypothetical protein
MMVLVKKEIIRKKIVKPRRMEYRDLKILIFAIKVTNKRLILKVI